MRKLSFFLTGITALFALSLTSCDTEDPTEEFTGTISTTSIAVDNGDTAWFTLTATASSANDLASIQIDDEVGVLEITSILKDGVQPASNPIIIATAAGETGTWAFGVIPDDDESVDYTVTVTDAAAQTVTFTVTITSVANDPATSETTMKLLGAQLASAGSYYSSSEGVVYTSSQTSADNSKVDFSFYQTGTASAPIATIGSLNARGVDGLTTNTSGNITYLATSSLAYATATDGEIDAITASTSEKVTVAVNGVYEFVTHTGKKGIFTVTALNDGTNYDGDVTISVKVQD